MSRPPRVSPLWQASLVIGLLGLLALAGPLAGAAVPGDPKMGQIAMGKNANGCLEVFRVSSDGQLQHRWQTTPSGEWSPWWGLGGSFLPGLAVAQRVDGQLEVFAVEKTTRSLACIRQSMPNGPGWSSWTYLGGRVCAPVAVGLNQAGCLEVFGVDPDTGAVGHLWQTNQQDGWSGWATLGARIEAGLAVARNKEGLLELFGVDAQSHALVHCTQAPPSGPGSWGAWRSLGGNILAGPVVGQRTDQELEVFAVNRTNGAVDHIWQITTTNGVRWSTWASLGGSVRQGIALGKNADGRLEVFAAEVKPDRGLLHSWQEQASDPHSWSPLWGIGEGAVEPDPAVGLNQDGSLIVVARDANHPTRFNYKRQISANSDWLDWFSMDQPIFPYTARIWKSDDGLPNTEVQAIAQTTDGYLWVGTRGGLACFDGVQFTVFDGKNFPELQASCITALCADREGSLWIGLQRGGVVCLRGGLFTHYGRTNGLAGDSVSTIIQGKDGSIWFGTTTGMSRYKNHQFTPFTREQGLLSDDIRSIYEDRILTLWIGTAAGLNFLKSDNTMGAFYNRGNQPGTLPDNSIRAITQDRGGRLWIGADTGMIWHHDTPVFYSYDHRYGLPNGMVDALCEDRDGNLWVGTHSGLYRFREGRFFNECDNEGASYDKVNSIFEDRDANLWVGSRDGLIRLTPKRFSTYDTRSGLSYNDTVSVLEDRANTLWVGTAGGGLNHLQEEGTTVYTHNNGLANNRVLATCQAHDGSLWVGLDSDGGLDRLQNGKFIHYSVTNGLPEGTVRVLDEDRSGRLWIGTTHALSCFKGGTFTNYTREEGLAGEEVRAIHEDAGGRLWIGTSGGLCRLEQTSVPHLAGPEGVTNDTVLALCEDKQGDLWIGTARQGLFRRRAGRFTHYTTPQGLFSDEIFEILEDDYGWLWMSCSQGIFRVRKTDFDALDQGRAKMVASIAYGQADGMESTLCNGLAQPAGCKTHDGKLWFPTAKGVVVVDPNHVAVNETPPPVFIEQMMADRKPMLQGIRRLFGSPETIVVPPGFGELEFHFTALAFQKPEKNRLKYRLEGADREWIEADPRRTAHYLNLAPGQYRFRVIACNSDAVWNDTGTSLTIELKPHFWQTWWFRALIGMLAMGLVGGTARYLTRRRMQRKLDQMERQRAIEHERARIAKDIHDDLGSNVTRIMMLGDRVKTCLPGNLEAGEHARKIVDTARATVQSLDEIVWAVNPENDTLDSLIGYLGQYADQFFEGSGVRCRRELPMTSFPFVVGAELRHNLLQVVKEALNNTLKHAHASEVQLQVLLADGRLTVSIQDDGRGFELPASIAGGAGNGLGNMRKRVQNLGGELSLASQPGLGTKLVFTVNVQAGR